MAVDRLHCENSKCSLFMMNENENDDDDNDDDDDDDNDDDGDVWNAQISIAPLCR